MTASHATPGHFLTPFAAPRKGQLWVGRILSAVPVLMLMFSGFMKITHAPQMVVSWVNQFGWSERLLTPVGLTEVACALVFAIPRTAVLGAILVASFLGGAFAAHLRVGDAGGGAVPIMLAVLAWIGVYLREDRLRPLIPLRRFRRARPELATMP